VTLTPTTMWRCMMHVGVLQSRSKIQRYFMSALGFMSSHVEPVCEVSVVVCRPSM
jgi:hypothetical protein